MAIEMKKYTIKVTVQIENNLWIGLFERNDDEGYAVARKIFGGEPSDAELYDFVLTHFDELKFTEPQNFTLIIKRKNYKRMQRDVKREMEKSKSGLILRETHAQEVLRLDLEKNKKIKKTLSKTEKEAHQERLFQLKQEKRKKKHKGH